jgi:hypothetical protein
MPKMAKNDKNDKNDIMPIKSQNAKLLKLPTK